jgi:hypothetical protein
MLELGGPEMRLQRLPFAIGQLRQKVITGVESIIRRLNRVLQATRHSKLQAYGKLSVRCQTLVRRRD